MNGAAGSAHPPHAVIAWVDDSRIYVELPGANGIPQVLTYDRTPSGFAEALNVLVNRHARFGAPASPRGSTAQRAGASPEAKALALARLKKAGVL